MRTYREGEEIIVVTPNGIIRGKINHYDKIRKSYTVHTLITDGYDCFVTLYNVKSSLIYGKEDFGRASDFFKSRYL